MRSGVPVVCALLSASMLGLSAEDSGPHSVDWRIAEPGWQYVFPPDHHLHADFKTEWWYFTGNLNDESGRRFGYEITFFREGIRPPDQRQQPISRFVVDQLKFAHFAITDAKGRRFLFQQKTSRGSFGEAGFDAGDRIAWLDDWGLSLNGDGSFDLEAQSGDVSARLHLVPAKRPVIHGENGVSVKASAAGHASCYYSITRLGTTGTLRIDNLTHPVTGESWFDHEWATNQLAADEIGWHWLSVQFADGTELMLYQMRLRNGGVDPSSSGTFIRSDGSTLHLSAADYGMRPTRFWKSDTTGAQYPISWQVDIPKLGLQLQVAPVLENQELALGPLTYWEGAVDIAGAAQGRGYLELTGYASPMRTGTALLR